ncbi:MAG: hypothetical protein AB7K24_13295 [Gemmataceae bacterium]
MARRIEVKIAATASEWQQAYQLVADNYQLRGYDGCDGDVHFTAHHALPDTVTFVALDNDRVVATMSLVADNVLLGLPMESLYASEIKALRGEGRRLGEVTSLAAAGLTFREFTPVFHELIRLMKQHHLRQGGDTWVITVNPRHRNYYSRLLGYLPLGPRRDYAKVQGHPAEAYYVDVPLMRVKAADMHRRFFGVPVSEASLLVPKMPAYLALSLAERSCQTDRRIVAEVLRFTSECGSPRRW